MKKLISATALMIALCILTTACMSIIPMQKEQPPAAYKEIEYFTDEAELLSYIKENFSEIAVYPTDDRFGLDYANESVDIAPTPAPGATPSAPNGGTENSKDVSETNVQTEGVDEGDILKTDGNYVYVVQGSAFNIVDIQGELPQIASAVDLSEYNTARYVNEMYIKDNTAILICHDDVTEEHREIPGDFGVDDPTGTYVPQPYIYYTYKHYTTVLIYDITDRTRPMETRRISFEGGLISSRETDGKLFLVTNKYFNRFHNEDPEIIDVMPVIMDSALGDISPDAWEIAKCPRPDPATNMLTIATIDYSLNTEPETFHMMGSGSDIYMSRENLYVFSTGWNENGFYTEILKYSVKDGISFIGTAKAPGYASTQFSYDEYDGKFRIATTSNVYNGEKYVDMNNIYVYDENMVLCGSLTGLAPDESIKSARFMGDTAYVVTFRQVDPLFVIDMSKDDPKVMGELKIPGFSTYLHPVGEGLLLGIGSETVDNVYGDFVSTSVSGLKVSLFDVSDPTNPTELDVASYVGGKDAYSVAKDNHNAFVYSSATNTGYFPITVYDELWNSTDTLVEVKVNGNKLDVRVADIPEISGSRSESRVCYSGDHLYLFRESYLTKLHRDSLEFIGETKLEFN